MILMKVGFCPEFILSPCRALNHHHRHKNNNTSTNLSKFRGCDSRGIEKHLNKIDSKGSPMMLVFRMKVSREMQRKHKRDFHFSFSFRRHKIYRGLSLVNMKIFHDLLMKLIPFWTRCDDCGLHFQMVFLCIKLLNFCISRIFLKSCKIWPQSFNSIVDYTRLKN